MKWGPGSFASDLVEAYEVGRAAAVRARMAASVESVDSVSSVDSEFYYCVYSVDPLFSFS